MMTLGGTKSHKIPFYEIANALEKRGHKITLLSGFKNEKATIKEIVPKAVQSYIEKFSNRDMLGARMVGKLPVPIVDVLRYPIQVCKELLQDSDTESLLSTKFDVAVIDGAFPECGLGLIYKMNIPFMYLNTVGLYTGSLANAGNPTVYSYIPSFAIALSDDMVFTERLLNIAWHIFLKTLHSLTISVLRLSMQRYLGKLPDLYDMSANVSFILQNGSPTLTYPRPLLPNVAEIACVHCRKPKQLPEDIRKFIDASNSGVIYISMGSSVRASKMPAKLRRIMFETFKRFPNFRFLWKWEENDKAANNLPKNVKISNWFPQQDILGDPSLKAFVTHGGLLSLFESVFHGVPVVIIPVFCDHDANAAKAVNDGYGVKLELASISTKSLTTSIQRIMDNSSFKASARLHQKLFLDQYNTPLETSTYWIEYVIRHGGAKHLQSKGRNYSVIKYYSLDVYFFYFLVMYSVKDLYSWFNNVKISVKIA